MDPRTALRDWLDRSRMSQRQAASAWGCSQSMVSAVLTGARRPDLTLAFAIEKATSGEVAARAWADEEHDGSTVVIDEDPRESAS